MWLVVSVNGTASIYFSGLNERLGATVLREGLADAPFEIVSKKGKVVLQSRSEALDPDVPFADQLDAAKVIVDSLLALRDWWEREGLGAIESLLAANPVPEADGQRDDIATP